MKNCSIFILSFMLIVLTPSCKKAELNNQKRKLIGTWARVNPECNLPNITCDSLRFSKKNTYIHLFDHSKLFTYEVVKKDSIRMSEGKRNYGFEFTDNDSRVIIKKFYPSFNFGESYYDVTYEKVN